MREVSLVDVTTTETGDAVQATYGLLLARLGSEATARFRCSLRPFGLSAQQFIVLKMVEARGPASQSELADALGMDYSNLGGVMNGLCDRGLIVRSRDPKDRRRYSVALTEDGARLLTDLDATIRRGDDEMLAALGPDELAQLGELLRRVAGSLGLPTEGEDAEVCTEAVHEAG